MITMLSGALKISSSNMTSGNFLSGETLLSNGVIRPEIIQEFEEAKNITKTKDTIISRKRHMTDPVGLKTRARVEYSNKSPVVNANNNPEYPNSANARFQSTPQSPINGTPSSVEGSDEEPSQLGQIDDYGSVNDNSQSGSQSSESETETAPAAAASDMSGSDSETEVASVSEPAPAPSKFNTFLLKSANFS